MSRLQIGSNGYFLNKAGLPILINQKRRVFNFPYSGPDFSNFLADNKLDHYKCSLSKFQVNSSNIGSSRAMSNSKLKILPLKRP